MDNFTFLLSSHAGCEPVCSFKWPKTLAGLKFLKSSGQFYIFACLIWELWTRLFFLHQLGSGQFYIFAFFTWHLWTCLFFQVASHISWIKSYGLLEPSGHCHHAIILAICRSSVLLQLILSQAGALQHYHIAKTGNVWMTPIKGRVWEMWGFQNPGTAKSKNKCDGREIHSH